MNWAKRGFGVSVGLAIGLVIGATWRAPAPTVWAANDRHEDFILCTGPAAIRPGAPTDGVWLLDYRTGRLLGTLVDRNNGKVVNWAEVDLVKEFGLSPRQGVHFLMTTGGVAHGQAALYLAETTSGKFGVYTLGQRADGQPGVA